MGGRVEVDRVDVGDEPADRGRARRSRPVPRSPWPARGRSPPMPMLITARMRSPVAPTHASVADAVGQVAHPAQHGMHVGHHILAVDRQLLGSGMRSATCSTARSSVELMCTPENMASRRASTPVARARSNRRDRVSSVTRCLE